MHHTCMDWWPCTHLRHSCMCNNQMKGSFTIIGHVTMQLNHCRCIHISNSCIHNMTLGCYICYCSQSCVVCAYTGIALQISTLIRCLLYIHAHAVKWKWVCLGSKILCVKYLLTFSNKLHTSLAHQTVTQPQRGGSVPPLCGCITVWYS